MADDDDTKILRKNMFICNYLREDHLHQVNLRKLCTNNLHWKPVYDCENYQRNYNRALQDIDVLENITSYLANEDLFSCRLVCKFWCLEITRFLAKRKCLIIVEEECREADILFQKRAEGCPVAVAKACLFDTNSNSITYKKLFSMFGQTLSSVCIVECGLSPADLKRIFFVESPSIQKFHFKEVQQKNCRRISTFQQIKKLNENTFILPKMKMLHWDEEGGRTDLREIVEACPNLVSLELRGYISPTSTVFKGLRWLSLRNLFLSPKGVLNDEHCKALANLQLSLEKLTIFGINPRDNSAMKSLSKFLATLSETIETLELWLDYASILANTGSESYSPFPVFLPKVHRLKTESEILGHIKHLSKLPSLADLEVISNPHERQNWDPLTKRCALSPRESLRSFRCGDIDQNSLKKMMKVFPSITSLRLYSTHVNDSFLRTVITNLPCLTDLSIGPCMLSGNLRISDSGITGVSHELCRKLSQSPGKLKNADINSLKRHPGISDLKYLQTLDFGLQTSEITDVSVLLGISTLVKLSSLKLPLSLITDTSLNAIEQKLTSLVLLGIAGCKLVSSEGIENFKTRRKGIIIENELPPMFETF